MNNGVWLSLVEYLNGVQVAAGSNPVTPTIPSVLTGLEKFCKNTRFLIFWITSLMNMLHNYCLQMASSIHFSWHSCCDNFMELSYNNFCKPILYCQIHYTPDFIKYHSFQKINPIVLIFTFIIAFNFLWNIIERLIVLVIFFCSCFNNIIINLIDFFVP